MRQIKGAARREDENAVIICSSSRWWEKLGEVSKSIKRFWGLAAKNAVAAFSETTEGAGDLFLKM